MTTQPSETHQSSRLVQPPEPASLDFALRLDELTERRLGGRCSALALRRSTVPMVELRIALGLGSDALLRQAALAVLDESATGGTQRRDRAGLAAAVQALGGQLALDVGRDRAVLRASALSQHFRALLELVGEVLSEATYPDDVVAGDRRRVAEEVVLARSEPSVQAREALDRRVLAGHPYRLGLPSPGAVRRVRAEELRALHHDVLARSETAAVVVVGDVEPAEALEQVEVALQRWLAARSQGSADQPPGPIPAPERGPTLLVERDGAVQSNVRLGGLAPTRRDPAWPAAALANLAFGGLFSSRLVENLRERRGYTYSPRSSVEHLLAGSRFVVTLDVATEVTAPALVEVAYELGRAASVGFDEAEVEGARRYALGSLLLSTATQAGLAGWLVTLALEGLDPTYLERYARSLADCDVAAVSAAAARLLAPAGLATVVLGDPAVEGPLAALGSLRRARR